LKIAALLFCLSSLQRFCSSLSETYWALTNVVNTLSFCCISPRIRVRLLVFFLRTLISLFLSLWIEIIPHHNTWNPDCNTPFAFCFWYQNLKQKWIMIAKKVRRHRGLKTYPKLHGLSIDERNKPL
jgi:hypothetical protein